VTAEEIIILAVEADEQTAKFVNPSKGSLARKAVLVDIRIEQAFAATFDGFTTALVESDIGHNAIVETDFASSESVEAGIRIEKGTLKGKTKPLHGLKGGL